MRVTIKGLTDSTITLNSIGIIIRGNSSKMEQYPGSVAKSIDINGDDQLRELITLKNAKLIDYVDENLPIQQTKEGTQTVNISKPTSKITFIAKSVKPTETEVIEAIEDMPTKPNNSFSEDELTINPKKTSKKGRPKGRPKGSTKAAMKKKAMQELNKTPSITVEPLINATKATKVVKTIKKLDNVTSLKGSKVLSNPLENLSKQATNTVDGDGNPIIIDEPDPNYGKIEPDDSNIVIMTPGGAIKGEMINNMAGELDESEATLASIEALKKLESEENSPDVLVDESKFDDSDKMGGSAVVVTGDNKMKKVPMKNSILPESDVLKNKPIQWINPKGDSEVIEEKTEEIGKTEKTAFISDDGDPNGIEDSFI